MTEQGIHQLCELDRTVLFFHQLACELDKKMDQDREDSGYRYATSIRSTMRGLFREILDDLNGEFKGISDPSFAFTPDQFFMILEARRIYLNMNKNSGYGNREPHWVHGVLDELQAAGEISLADKTRQPKKKQRGWVIVQHCGKVDLFRDGYRGDSNMTGLDISKEKDMLKLLKRRGLLGKIRSVQRVVLKQFYRIRTTLTPIGKE